MNQKFSKSTKKNISKTTKFLVKNFKFVIPLITLIAGYFMSRQIIFSGATFLDLILNKK